MIYSVLYIDSFLIQSFLFPFRCAGIELTRPSASLGNGIEPNDGI